METLIRGLEPVAGTRTHVLLDSWYCAKCLWHAARERDFLITTGLKSNRWLRVPDETAAAGWRWQKLSDYVASLTAQDFVQTCWPRGGKQVYVHVVTSSIRKLYRCQIVIVQHSLDAPLSQARYWASSDLEANTETLLAHISTRWDIEILFGDSKEELGLDHYQLMSASAILRFWTLALLVYVFLEEDQQRLRVLWQRPVSIGEARREIQRRHRRRLLEWLYHQFLSGLHPETSQPQSAKIEQTDFAPRSSQDWRHSCYYCARSTNHPHCLRRRRRWNNGRGQTTDTTRICSLGERLAGTALRML